MKVCFLILILINSLSLFAQMSVERIRNKKDTESFLRTYYLKGKDSTSRVSYYSDSVFQKEWIDKKARKYFYSKSKRFWIKDDFNQDGKLDLIWNGCIDGNASVFGFISSATEGYIIHKLSNIVDEEAFHIILKLNKGVFVLQRINSDNREWDSSYTFKERLVTDTLIFWNGYFTNFNNTRTQVEFLTVNVWSSYFYTDETYTICKNDSVGLKKYSLQDSFLYEGLYGHPIHFDSVNNLFKLIETFPFKSFSTYYMPVSFRSGHGVTYTTNFYFGNGTYKTVKSYMNSGPIGLRNLIDYIIRLRKSKQWSVVSYERW